MIYGYFHVSIVCQAEVNFLGDLLHPNLVKLIGYCIEDDQRLLVYELCLMEAWRITFSEVCN